MLTTAKSLSLNSRTLKCTSNVVLMCHRLVHSARFLLAIIVARSPLYNSRRSEMLAATRRLLVFVSLRDPLGERGLSPDTLSGRLSLSLFLSLYVPPFASMTFFKTYIHHHSVLSVSPFSLCWRAQWNPVMAEKSFRHEQHIMH